MAFVKLSRFIFLRLSQVDLLASKNSVGKTMILETCHIYAARGHYSVLWDLGQKHEKYATGTDEDSDKFIGVDLSGLFFSREKLRKTSSWKPDAKIANPPKSRLR